MQTATIYQFPLSHSVKKEREQGKPKNGDTVKCLTEEQAKALMKAVRDQAATGRMTAVREWMAVDLLLSSGLRVSECVDLRCGSLKAGYGQSALFVANGKGNKSRTVQITNELKRHIKSFIIWKKERGEPTGPDDFIFQGQRGPWTIQAVELIVKKYLRALGIYEKGKSAHCLRHTYASHYYRRTGHDLRGLQKQLGHSSIETTQIYADVTQEDIQDNIRNLWN